MPVFPPQQTTLRRLVEMSRACETAEFLFFAHSKGDSVDFQTDKPDGGHTFAYNAVGQLVGTPYVVRTTGSLCRVTDEAFAIVDCNFDPPPRVKPAMSNVINNSGYIGSVNQLNITAASQHAASEAIAVLRGLLPTLPAAVADEVEQFVADLDAEVATATPKASRVKSALLAMAAAVKGYAAPLKAVADIAQSLGLGSLLAGVVCGF